MTKRRKTEMFDDPVPNPYPEMMGEVFESLREDGIAPDDVRDPEIREQYRKWLETAPDPDA